jgi:cytochrome c-type biogenesis protein CcmH
MYKIILIFISLLIANLFASSASANFDIYSFKNDAQQARYIKLTEQLRCPKCQNNDIADSDAPIAADMRREVHRMILENKSDQEIVKFMVDRFGEFVMFKPRVKSSTYLLWYGPLILAVLGFFTIVALGRKKKGLAGSESGQGLSKLDQEKLASLLNEEESKK